MARIDIGKIIDLAGVIKNVLHDEAAKPSTSLEPSDVNKVTQQVTDAVKKEVNPVLANATNQEPLWQSRIFIGAIIAAGLQIATVVGLKTDFIDPQSATTLVMQVISIASALYAAKARATTGQKPLGE